VIVCRRRRPALWVHALPDTDDQAVVLELTRPSQGVRSMRCLLRWAIWAAPQSGSGMVARECLHKVSVTVEN
jgi:hypothetical protein